MKKVKIMLTAITVFAVVGGALAFKANYGQGNVFCDRLDAQGEKHCDFKLQNIKTTNLGSATTCDGKYTTISTTDPCPSNATPITTTVQ